jgi:hypothetical protein
MKPLISQSARLQFHSIFASWMLYAQSEETDQLDALLDDFPSTEVRSMVTFIRDCLATPARREKLPQNLLQRLQSVNWPQGEFVLQVA